MVVLVTGASVGFGREIAKIFAKNGHKVIALARRKEKLESLQKEIGNCVIIACDICDRETKKIVSIQSPNYSVCIMFVPMKNRV